jgi:hypothetical protein
MFTADKVQVFVQQFEIKMIHSIPYYAQSNGQTETTHKVLINLIKKNIDDEARKWHEILQEVQWAHRNSRIMAIGFTPIWLTLGLDTVLPEEITIRSARVAV